MEQRLVIITLTLSYFVLTARAINNVKVTLECHYNHPTPVDPDKRKKTTVTTRTQDPNDSIRFYFLKGDSINNKVLFVKEVSCLGPQPHIIACNNTYGTYISLQDVTDDTLLKIERSFSPFLDLLFDLMFLPNAAERLNITCHLVDPPTTGGSGSHKPDGFPDTNLFGIIFLSVCSVLVCGFCTLWTTVLYYRRCIQHRKERKVRQALLKSTEQMLANSPVIIFEENGHDNGEEEPMCAICLDSFKSKDKIRKLVCEHLYHITCIDPWLLSHQSCPLCNRNILQDPIPSISSSVMAIRDDHVTTDVNSSNNHTIPMADTNL